MPDDFLLRQQIALANAFDLMRSGDLALAKGYLDVAREELESMEGGPQATTNGTGHRSTPSDARGGLAGRHLTVVAAGVPLQSINAEPKAED